MARPQFHPEMSSPASRRWKFFIDRGGTFTDIIAVTPDGAFFTEKLLSENPNQYNDAATAGIRKILRLPADEKIPVDQITCIKIGTTVATNALLERTGAPTVLITNKGFKDALKIGYQNRPDIFARKIVLPDQLYSYVIEATCRYDFEGNELCALDDNEITGKLKSAYARGFRTCAIVMMHGYNFPAHELRIEHIAAEIGFTQISTSHKTSPFAKLVSRGDTTVADASLSPVLNAYMERLNAELKGTRTLFMQSSGALSDAAHFKGKDSLLSGPAGGAVGAAEVGKSCGFKNVISFDMGGTSTDVSHIANGTLERISETTLAGVRIKSPMVAVNTVAAGGGSICSYEGLRMRVGPKSAGAIPGPACYGKGGPLTVTDCNVLLGRIQPNYFPKVFGPNNDQGLDETAVKTLFRELTATVADHTDSALTPEVVAQGFLDIAVAKMANAIRQISIEKGHDIAQHALVAFGGAGGQHACQIADALGLTTILVHPLASVLSAYGIGIANVGAVKHQAVEKYLDEEGELSLRRALNSAGEASKNAVKAQMLGEEQIVCDSEVWLRYLGTDFSIAVKPGEIAEMEENFATQHRLRFGFISPNKKIIIESVACTTEARTNLDWLPKPTQNNIGNRAQKCKVYTQNRWQTVDLWIADQIGPDTHIEGPALVADKMTTTFIEPEWRASITSNGTLILKRAEDKESDTSIANNFHSTRVDVSHSDPSRLELFYHMFMSIAEQMGTALQMTSQSINMKERLDFSCAIFDKHGRLVANAPHIPVHLGSMSACVQNIIEKRSDSFSRGDAYVSNNPYAGGTHLPDITVVSPVFMELDTPSFYVASRGHHSDIGGITPGSMPANSRTLIDEGVVIDNFHLVKNELFEESALTSLLESAKYPARNIPQNIADLKAQVAANKKGEQALSALCAKYGEAVVQNFMRLVQENARAAVGDAICRLKDGNFSVELDGGAKISVAVTIDRDNKKADIDFAGTSPQLESNMNAPRAITNAAVIYVFRTLLDDDIPLNDGFLDALTIKVPEDSFLNPQYPAAIVAGNVETSQQITDALYGALGVMAASQGTMNNFTFGDESSQYYETISGGAGAGPDFDGASAVQTNMTNSRLTDPEILESRFPVLVEEFSIRTNSGGAGMHYGGDGVVRKIKFRKQMSASILSLRRKIAPFGLDGGHDGARGLNYIVKANGDRVNLNATATVELSAGDTFVIETPGGGGFGLPNVGI